MSESSSHKRDAVRAYKERRRQRGVFSVTCAATGERWVAATQNLETHQNGVWFTLRTGSHPNRALQAAWNAHGESAFSYDVLEELGEEVVGDYAIKADLKAMATAWREKLGAGAVTG